MQHPSLEHLCQYRNLLILRGYPDQLIPDVAEKSVYNTFFVYRVYNSHLEQFTFRRMRLR